MSKLLAVFSVAAPYKVCTCCGRVFATRDDFEALPLCGSGFQPQYDDNGDARTDVYLELRNCGCGSTICVEVAFAPGQFTCCGSDTSVHAFTCDERPATCCDSRPCVCDAEVLP